MSKVISVNVGLPREVIWNGKPVSTGIFKSPVTGPVSLRRHNLTGDAKADLSVHGGPTKAVYVYPAEYYVYWRNELKDREFTWGEFGENLTVEGLNEEDISIGDEYQVGTARVVVTEPRMPCFKLGIRFGSAGMVKRFLDSQRMGFYFGVVEEGRIQAGDQLERVSMIEDGLRVSDVTRLYTTEKRNIPLLKRAISTDELTEKWRGYFQYQLQRL